MPDTLSRQLSLRACVGDIVLHDHRDQQSDHQREGADRREAFAPADRGGRDGERRGRNQGSERADAHLQAG
jgi:hypothetical protein